MERKNRNLWIAVAVIALVLCCGAVAVIAAVWAVFRIEEVGSERWNFDFGPLASAQVEQTFEVGEEPYLDLGNFAGDVDIRAGEDNLIRVVATKKAPGSTGLSRVTVHMSRQGDRVTVRTEKQNGLSNASVYLDIVAPPGTELALQTGAGTIDIRDMTGVIEAHSGAGTIEVTGAAGQVQLGTGAGSVQYQGTPAGRCRFESGAGDIRLRLPANPNVRVDLSIGVGTIDVDYDVDGSVKPRDVTGVIGDGGEATIYANTGVGVISVGP